MGKKDRFKERKITKSLILNPGYKEDRETEGLEREVSSENVENANASYLFYKIHLRSIKSNIYGIILVKINMENKVMEMLDAAVSSFSHFLNTLTLRSSWSDHYQFITNKKFSGDFNSSLTNDIVNQLRILIEGRSSFDNVTPDLITYYQKDDIKSIMEIFKPPIARICFDKNVTIDLNMEIALKHEISEFNEDQLKKKFPNEEKSDSMPKESFFEEDKEMILLDCVPVLAPANGIPIFRLTPGQSIFVKILHTFSIPHYSNYKASEWIDEEGKIISKKGVVVKTKFEEGKHKILLHLYDNVYGKIIESEQIKVKPSLEENLQPVEQENKSTRYFFIISIASVSFLLLLLIFFIIMFE